MNPDDTGFALPDGSAPLLGLIHPTELRFGVVPAWEDANPILPESEWEAHDDFAQFDVGIRFQQNSNCTNAAWAQAQRLAFMAAGVPNVPLFSMGYQYALNNGGRDAGAMCRDVAAGGKFQGNPPESVWPSTQIYVPRGGMPAAAVAEAAKWEVLEVYQCLRWADVASALTRRFIVYHGFVLGQAFFRTGADGRVPRWDGSASNGHALYSRGLTRKFGDLRTITPNSWGPTFGDKGVGYIDPSYFWDQRGNFVNLDAYAIRAVKRTDLTLPVAA